MYGVDYRVSRHGRQSTWQRSRVVIDHTGHLSKSRSSSNHWTRTPWRLSTATDSACSRPTSDSWYPRCAHASWPCCQMKAERARVPSPWDLKVKQRVNGQVNSCRWHIDNNCEWKSLSTSTTKKFNGKSMCICHGSLVPSKVCAYGTGLMH